MKIAVFGTGYVGLVTGVCFAEMGNHVTCVDIDPKKVNDLRLGKSPIYEPGLEDMLQANIGAERIHFTTESLLAIENSDLIFIAVGTPPHEDGSADLSYVLQVAKTIGLQMNGYKLVITKSTVPVGTNHKVKSEIQETLRGRGVHFEFDVVSNPEFLREGSALQDALKASRVVIGVETPKAEEIMTRLYEPFLKGGNPLLVMDLLSAEMTKYAANSMLAAKISLMNEFSRLCEKVGADIEHVRRGIGTDHRIGPYSIYPGIGYGGSCFPKDVKALIRTGMENGERLEILEAVETANATQRKNFFRKIKRRFSELEGKKIAVWGVAFKPGTDDIREAPALDVITDLLLSGAHLVAFDPVAAKNALEYFQDARWVGESLARRAQTQLSFSKDQYTALDGTDALAIITEWKSFREPDFGRMKSLMKSPVIFDGRNIYSPDWIRGHGFEYQCVGRP